LPFRLMTADTFTFFSPENCKNKNFKRTWRKGECDEIILTNVNLTIFCSKLTYIQIPFRLAKNFLFWQNFDDVTKLWFSWQYFYFSQNFDELTKILFSWKYVNFWQNFDDLPKFWFSDNISIFDKNTIFLTIYRFLTKFWLSWQYFNFRQANIFAIAESN